MNGKNDKLSYFCREIMKISPKTILLLCKINKKHSLKA
jgi:hypothetical protein